MPLLTGFSARTRPDGWQRKSVIGKSSPAVPQVASASDTAAAQGQSNVSTAAAQAALNNVNQNTPYGSTSYAPTGSYTTPQGDTVPTYTQNVSLSPMGQAILSGEQRATDALLPAAQTVAGQAAGAVTKPLDFNTPFSPTLSTAPQQLDKNAADAIYGQQKSFLDPQWNNQEKLLQDQLSRQGIPVGSEAYNNALTQLQNGRTQAYQSAQNAATAGGAQAAATNFGLAQAGQNQNIQQQQTAQQQPLSLLSQLFGATPAPPTQPISTPSQTGISPTDLVGATAASNSAAMQAYQAQVAQNNATTGGVAGTVGALALAGATAF